MDEIWLSQLAHIATYDIGRFCNPYKKTRTGYNSYFIKVSRYEQLKKKAEW